MVKNTMPPPFKDPVSFNFEVLEDHWECPGRKRVDVIKVCFGKN